MQPLIDRVFQDLSIRFRSPAPLTNADVSDRPFRALKLITRLREPTVASNSYMLFETIMRSTVAPTRKMEAARLALRGAFQPGLENLPRVGNPKHILDFLCCHVDPLVEPEARAHAISSVMRAINCAHDNRRTTWCIENAGELMTWFQQSANPEEFAWWYGVLWLHYEGLDPGVRDKVDEVARSGDDRIDLKLCRFAVEKDIERMTELGVDSEVVNSLHGAYNRLTALIDHRDRVRDELLGFRADLMSFLPLVSYTGPVHKQLS